MASSKDRAPESNPASGPQAETLGDLLTQRRKALNLSREQLGTKAGISPHTLAKYESEGQVPTAGKLAALCLHLRLDPREALLFSLGDGEGALLAFRNDRRWHDFVEFIGQLEQAEPTTKKLLARSEGLAQQMDGLVSTLQAIVQAAGDFHSTIEKKFDQAESKYPGAFGPSDPAATAKFLATIASLKTSIENGPGRKDLDRSLGKTKPNEAAPTASRSKPKRRKPRRPDR